MTYKIVLPYKMSTKLAELIGIHVGDGSLYKDKKGDYTITFTGNLNERDYMDYVNNLFFSCFGVKMKMKVYSKTNSIQLRIRSKNIFYFLRDNLALCEGPKNKLLIPNCIKSKKCYSKYFLRGLFDTDGCVTVQNMGKYKYPIVKITTKHNSLAQEILECFREFNIPCYLTKKNLSAIYDVSIRNKNVDLFFKKIGSKNYKNIRKLEGWGRRDLNPHLGS